MSVNAEKVVVNFIDTKRLIEIGGTEDIFNRTSYETRCYK
jgi:hypothetical protein